jgi:hypothetical protein
MPCFILHFNRHANIAMLINDYSHNASQKNKEVANYMEKALIDNTEDNSLQ